MEIADVLKEIRTPASPRGVTWDGEALWVALEGPHRAVRLDPDSGAELGGIDLPSDGVPTGLVWSGQGETPSLWHALGDRGVLVEVRPGDGEIRRLDLVEKGVWIRGLATDGAAGPTLWFVEAFGEGESQVARAGRVDVRDGEIHKRIVLEPDAAGLAWDGRWLWYARSSLRRLVRVDPMFAETNFQLETDFSPLGLTFDGKTLWAADAGEHRIVQIACPPR